MKDKLEVERTSSDGTDEEKYRDRGSSTSGRNKIICEEPGGQHLVSRKHSSPPAPDDTQHQQKMRNLRTGSSPRRPVSYTPSESGFGEGVVDKRMSLYSSGGESEMSPHRRRYAGGGGVTGSFHPGPGERPRVSFTCTVVYQSACAMSVSKYST